MPLLDKIKGLFAGKASDLVDSITSAVDEFTMSKEEKAAFTEKIQAMANAHTEKMAELAIEEARVEIEAEASRLADVANSRDMNKSIQESDKASWLSKNVAYCVDIFVILIWGCMTCYLLGTALKLLKTSNVDLTGIYGLYASVTAVAMTIINFHRGSSAGSERKQRQLEKMKQI